MRSRLIVIVFVTMSATAGTAFASTVKPYDVEITLEPGSQPGESLLTVHMEYDYRHTARYFRAHRKLSTVAEVHGADVSPTAHRHEIHDLSPSSNYRVIAQIPVTTDQKGYFSGAVTLNFVTDDANVVHGGKFLFWWKTDGNSTELIPASEFHGWQLQQNGSASGQPSATNLEAGDIPGQRVIHPNNVGDVRECGDDAVCPGRTR